MSISSDFSAWIGRRQESQDRISFTLVRRIAATLGESAPQPGEPLPPLWHWAFFQEPVVPANWGRTAIQRLGDLCRRPITAIACGREAELSFSSH